MNLGELIVDLSLDYAEFTQSLEQAKTAAFSAAASIEKSFQKISLSVDIDDKPLTDLNQHLNISVQHLKQANIFFKNNPITTYVNDDSLTDLNQHLDSKVRHLKEVNKFYAQNPITVRTNTSQLDELEERLDRLGNRKVTMEVDTIVLSQYQDKTAEVVERAIANAVREMQVPQSSGQSAQQSQPQQQNRVQRVQMGLDPLRSIGEGVFENVGKQLSEGIGSSIQDSLGVDMKSFTQIASNSVLRYFGVGKKAQKDPKNNKSKIKSIVEDAIKDYVSAVDKGSGSIRGELDDVDLSSVDAIAKNSLLRYFGVGKKAQSDPKNNRAKIKSIIEDAVQQYSGTEVKKENSGVISSTLSEINKAFSEAVNESVQEIAERAKAATIKKVRRASTNVLANSSSGVRDRVNSLLDAAESGKKGSIGQYIGRGLASQSRKAVEGTFSNLFPTVAPIVKEFLSTGNKPPVEKQAPKQRPADGLLEAANQLKEAAKAISESAIKVQSVAPVIHEQIADPWGSADLTPVQVPLKPAKQKTKKDEPEPELVLLEFPQQTQQHFRTLNAEVGKNTAKSLEFLKATTQENIKQQTTQSIANIKAALTAISQYFRSEYKQVKDAVDNAKATGHIDDINAARSAAKNYQRRSSGAIKEIDRIVKSGEDAGFNKEFGSELSQVHATGKGQLVASDKRVGQQLGGLNLLETNQFKKDVKLYTELAKKAGIEIDAGLIKGLDIGSAEVSAEARDLLNGLIATVKKTMGIQSPSRVMMAIGAMIAAGLVIGVKNGVVDVSSAVRLLTDNINKGMKEIDLSPVNPIETFNDAVQQSEGSNTKSTPSGLLGQLLPALKKDLTSNSILTNLFSSAKNAVGKSGSFKDIGINLITSFGQGILSSDDGVFAILGTFAKSAIGLVKKIFGIASLSKIMQSIGLDFGKGFEDGAITSLIVANKKIESVLYRSVQNVSQLTDSSGLNFSPTTRVRSQAELNDIASAEQARKERQKLSNRSVSEVASSSPSISAQMVARQRSSTINGIPDPWATPINKTSPSISAQMVARQRSSTINGIPDPWATPINKTVPSILSTSQPRIYPITPDPWGTTANPKPRQPNWVFHAPVAATNTSNNVKTNAQVQHQIQQPIPVKFDPQKLLGLTNDLANNVISAVANSIRQTRMSGNATLGQFMRNAVVAAGTAMSGSLMGALGGPLKTFFPMVMKVVSSLFPMIMKVALPMAGVAALKLGDATTGNLLKNGIFKQGGFLTELLSAFSGIKLGSMGGAEIKSAITGITEFLDVFPMLTPLAAIGTMSANAGVTAHDVFAGGSGEGRTVNTVLEEETAKNLKQAGVNSTGNSTADLVENLAETTVGALFRMIGFDGVKASAVQALIKGKVKKHSGEIAKSVGGVGKGQLSALIDGYVKGDSTQLAGTAESMLKNMGITGLDPKQVKLAANAITATLSGLHAKFGQEGFNLGNSINKGFKDSMKNLANVKDDVEYNIKKALGKATAGDVIGNILKRMSRGFVVDKGMFDEMWNQVGSAFKKGAFKGMGGDEQEGMFGNMMGFMASASAMLAPITTMAASLAPLFLPLMPIIAGIGGAIRMVMPQLSKLFDGIQRVEALQRRFTFLGGSKAGGIAELNYAKGVANQMNVSSEVSANAYSQLAIAAKGTKMEGQGVKDLFEGITASLSALGISGQDASLVFMAYTQIMAKGKLSMEELRQQLGEKFPPAMGVFAKAMGVSVSEMNDLVASGSILSQDILPKVAKVLNLDYGKSASGSADSLVLALTKLGNVGFEITSIFTDKLSGALAGVVNFASNGLGFLKDSLGTLIPLGQSFAIGFAATIAVGLSVVMTKIKPVVVLLGTLQSLVLSTFSAIASNLMPMIIGITSDVADGWLGAESDLMKNMYDGVNNMIVGLFSMVDSGARALSGKPLFAEGLIGGKGVNLVVAGIDAIKGALSAVFSVIPPGVVELGALVFMFEQAIALGSMALGPALVGGGKALLGMVVGIKDAFVGTMRTVKIWGELMMTSMSKAADVTDISAKRATIALAGWQLSMSVLRSMVTHVAIAMAILMFSKGDFSNPLGDKISETSKKVTVNLNNMKSAALSLGEAFDKAAGQLVNLNNKLTDTLPSKGAQLDIRNFWDNTKSTTSDDLTRNSNRAEIERRQREKDGKQTFGDRLRGFNQFTRNLTSFGLSGWSNDRLVPKTDDATIDLVKKYGLEEYIAPDKNLRIDMAQSQVIKALQDSEANIKVLNKKLAEIGLTKETQQNYLIPEKMGPVGNTFDIDARIKAANDKIARIDELDKKYTFYKGGRVDGRISKEENLSGFSFGGKTANPERIIRDDLDIEKNIIREKIKELENQRAIISQGVERFKSNKEIQLIDAQILDKVKRGVQLEKANPSDAVRKELGGIDAAVLELKTRREKIINGMGSDVKDNQEALDLLVQHKKDILDGADEATKAYSTQIRRVIANNVDPQIELVKNALEIAQKSVPAQFGDDLYQKAANKLRDTQIAFDRTGSADRIASLNFSASVNGSSERSANITPILANRQVADLEKQQKELDNLTKVKKETIDAYAAILRYGANKDVKDELEKLKADVLKDDESLAQLRNDIVTAKRGIRQALIDQTKQVADYYRTAVREAQAVSIEFQKAQKTLENSRMQNKLREALIGAGDNIYTQFIEGIINIISQTSEIEKQQLEAKKQRIDYENNVQDIRLQAAELQRSLPGKIIPLDSSIADNFNLSLEKIDGTVVTINDEVKDVANSLSKDVVDAAKKDVANSLAKDVVDAAKKANAELDKLNQSVQELDKTSNSWIDGFGSKFAGLFDVFKNGFDGIGGKINELQVQTATWLGSIGNAPSLFQNVQSAVTGVFEKRAGQQLEQVATDPLGAINSFLGAKDKILSPIQGTTIEDLLRYKPSYQQSFYGSRDEGARQHSKVDFDGRVKAGRNAEIIASLPGTATARKWTGNSGGVFIDSILPSGQKITLEYGHLSLESIKKTFGGQLGKSIEVQAGQKLGNVIQDALSKGPHLDFGVRLNGKYIDPQKFLQDFMGGKYQSSPAPKLPNLPNLDPRIDTKFLQDVSKIAQSVGANPEDLLKVMLYETGGTLSPSKRNSRTKATGLIQFIPATAKGLGTNIDALSQMTPQEQLFFVQKYLKQNSRGQKLDSFREVLSTVFAGNPNASLDVGDGDITLRNYLKKAEDRYGNIARQLIQIAIEGKAIDPDSMQGAVAQAGRLKLNTAAQQYQTNQINSNLSPEQIKDSELNQRLGAYRFIMSSRKTALGDISGTKDSTLGTRRTVLEGLFPNMSNAGRFWIQFENLRRKLEKDAEALQQIIEDTDGAIAQKPDLQAAFNLALKKFPNDPKLVADAIQTNDLSFKATAFKNAQARNDLSFLQSNTDGILQASIEDFDKKELFRFKEQSISEQTKVIEQLQQQLQLVRELKEIDPLNPLVLSIPALQRDIDLLSLNRDQYQQLLDLQRRYYDGGGKGGNMSEKAFQKEFRAILNVNSVKKEGTKLNFNYADTIEKIEQATKKLTKAQTLQSSQADAVKIRSDRFRLQNKETGLVDIQGIKDQFALDSESADIAFQKLVLENSGNFTLKPKERLLKTLRDYSNFTKRQNLSVAENINELEEGELKNQQVMINKAFAEREAGIKYDSRSSNIENLKSDYANPFYVNSLKRGLESEKLELEYDKSLAELNNRLKTESLGGIVRPEGYAASLRTDLLNNYLEKLKQVNKESKDFDSTIKDIAQQQLTSLSSGLTEVIMGTERLGDVLNSIANAFLSGALNALFSSWFSGKGGAGGGLLDLFSSGFSGEGDAGSPLDFNKGGVVPNYADGGVIGAIGDALQRERQASGVKPVLAALTPGERVLTVRQNKRFEELQMEKVLNYAGGGVVSSTSTPNMNFTAPSQSSTVNINVPVNVQGGQGDTSVNVPQLQNAIRSAVLSEIQKQQRPGGALGR
jgi:tape measure domain-containing protein